MHRVDIHTPLTAVRRMAPLLAALFAVISLGSLTSCKKPSFMGYEGRPLVVTSITPIGSIIRNVAGDRAEVEALVPPGASAFGYRLAESDGELVARASIGFFVGSGYDNLLMSDVSKVAPTGAPIVDFSSGLITAEASVPLTPSMPPQASQSPFKWLDPTEAGAFALIVRDALSRIDPDGTPAYRQNYDRFLAASERIGQAISETISTVPIANRKTYSQVDILDHYSARFGLTSLGASQSFDSPPPTVERANDIGRTLLPLALPAIFSTAPRVTPAFDEIARAGNVPATVMLRYEDLPGPPGSLSHTYFGLVIENSRLIAESLGGKSDRLSDIRPNDTAPA